MTNCVFCFSGDVITLECVEKIIKKDWIHPLTSKKLSEKDIIVMQRVSMCILRPVAIFSPSLVESLLTTPILCISLTTQTKSFILTYSLFSNAQIMRFNYTFISIDLLESLPLELFCSYSRNINQEVKFEYSLSQAKKTRIGCTTRNSTEPLTIQYLC